MRRSARSRPHLACGLSPRNPSIVENERAATLEHPAAPTSMPLAGDIIIANAPDPVFVSDLAGKILKANDAVFALLGFRPDELIEQSLSSIISSEETRDFLGALREVVEREEDTLGTEDVATQVATALRADQRGVT